MEIKTIKQATDRLKALGYKTGTHFQTLDEALAVVARAEAKAGNQFPKPVRDPHNPKPITPKPNRDPVHPKPSTPKAEDDSIDALKAAAKAERDPSAKVELLQKLSDRLLSDLNAESDPVKATDIRREWQNSEKNRAYALLAERAANPKAEKIRKYVDAASEDSSNISTVLTKD
jgi:hypothetical protein